MPEWVVIDPETRLKVDKTLATYAVEFLEVTQDSNGSTLQVRKAPPSGPRPPNWNHQIEQKLALGNLRRDLQHDLKDWTIIASFWSTDEAVA